MIYIISCRNRFESIRESRAEGRLALEVGAHLAHFVYLLRELQRLHGELVECAEFVVLAASAERALDVLQFALEPGLVAQYVLELLLLLGQFALELAVFLGDPLAFVLEEVQLAGDLVIFDF